MGFGLVWLWLMVVGSTSFAAPAEAWELEADALDEKFSAALDAARFEEAEEAARATLALRLENLTASHTHVAYSYGLLGTALDEQGRSEEALVAHLTALSIYQAAADADDYEVSLILNGIGTLKRRMGHFDEAREYLLRGLELREALEDPMPMAHTVSLLNLAELAEARGRKDEWMQWLERAEVAVRPVQDQPILRAVILSNLGKASQRSDPARSIDLQRRAAEEMARGVGEEHPHFAVALTNLASAHRAAGAFATARPLYDRALEIFTATLGDSHSQTSNGHAGVAAILLDLGETLASRHHYERAVAINRVALGDRHPDVAAATALLAAVITQHGDAEAAIPLYLDALSIIEETLGKSHPRYAELCNNLAAALRNSGRMEEAEARFVEAIAIWEENNGSDNVRVGIAKGNLGALYLKLGELERAESLLGEAMRVARLAHPDESHPSVAARYADLGALASRRGDRAGAARHYGRAMEVWYASVGPTHPRAIVAASRAGAAMFLVGDREAAREIHGGTIQASSAFIAEILPALSERQALAFIADQRSVLDQFLTSFDEDRDARVAWESALHWKGAVARVLAERSRSHDASGETGSALALVRAQMARLTLQGGAAEALSDLATERDRLERSLGTSSTGEAVSASAVCGHLPPGALLVDFLRYGSRGEQRYLAFVVNAECEVRRFEIGLAEEVDELVADYRSSLRAGDAARRVDARGTRLAERVWAPLEVAADTVYVVPDAALAGVPFGALPTTDGEYQIERTHIRYLDVATDLTRLRETAETNGVLLVGGVAFGEPAGAPIACVDEPFAALPGTLAEIVEIERRLKRRQSRSVLSGAAASEEAVVEAMEHSRVVHLATHGYAADDSCRSVLSGGIGYDPMTLSGLALAGANRPADPLDANDGILTAAEVSGLDLSGVELVVLSACDTGLGEVRAGQGVLGLRRAFATSGAGTLIMSLWAVGDASTVELMTEFYRHYRRGGDGSVALRRAQLSALERSRDTDAHHGSWAPFIAAGL